LLDFNYANSLPYSKAHFFKRQQRYHSADENLVLLRTIPFGN